MQNNDNILSYLVNTLFLQMSSVSTRAVILLFGVLKSHLERASILKRDEPYDNYFINIIYNIM